MIIFTQSIYSQTDVNKLPVIITADSKILSKDEIEICCKITNNSHSPIYFIAETKDVNGKKGTYVKMHSGDSADVLLENVVYPQMLYSPYSNQTSSLIKKLEAGTSYSSTIILKDQLIESIPPIEDPFKAKTIKLRDISNIELRIGFFPEEKGMVDYLNSKRFGWNIRGFEKFLSQDSVETYFYKVQHFLQANLSLKK